MINNKFLKIFVSKKFVFEKIEEAPKMLNKGEH